MWYFRTCFAPSVVLVVVVPHHSLSTGAVFHRSCISALVASVENMSTSPRQSTRRPSRGLASRACRTRRGVIALMTTCVVGKASSTAPTTRAAFASVISRPADTCHSPHEP